MRILAEALGLYLAAAGAGWALFLHWLKRSDDPWLEFDAMWGNEAKR